MTACYNGGRRNDGKEARPSPSPSFRRVRWKRAKSRLGRGRGRSGDDGEVLAELCEKCGAVLLTQGLPGGGRREITRDALVAWALGHRWLSVNTIERRFRAGAQVSAYLLGELVGAGVVDPAFEPFDGERQAAVHRVVGGRLAGEEWWTEVEVSGGKGDGALPANYCKRCGAHPRSERHREGCRAEFT